MPGAVTEALGYSCQCGSLSFLSLSRLCEPLFKILGIRDQELENICPGPRSPPPPNLTLSLKFVNSSHDSEVVEVVRAPEITQLINTQCLMCVCECVCLCVWC